MKRTRNSKLLADFFDYCTTHPEERFWQALCNWSGHNYIYTSKLGTHQVGEPPDNITADDVVKQLHDTFSDED